MKKIGLIGGLSPESTAQYYEIICREYNRRAGRLNFPEMSIESLNLQKLVQLFEVNDWDGVATVLLEALDRLRRAGAEFAAILANTPHNAYERIRDVTPLKIVTIMDATCAALTRDNQRDVALLGTRATMEYGFFQKHFEARNIKTYVPVPVQRQELDRIIWDELSHGVITPESRLAVKSMIDDVTQCGVGAIILACTELSLLIKPDDCPLPLYDTMQIHADAILEYALNDFP